MIDPIITSSNSNVHLLCSEQCSKPLCTLTHLIIHTTLRSRYHYFHLYFVDETQKRYLTFDGHKPTGVAPEPMLLTTGSTLGIFVSHLEKSEVRS